MNKLVIKIGDWFKGIKLIWRNAFYLVVMLNYLVIMAYSDVIYGASILIVMFGLHFWYALITKGRDED